VVARVGLRGTDVICGVAVEPDGRHAGSANY
jgi:hypothetical protein